MSEPSSLANVSFSSCARYTFLYEIGRGGMGIVYLAERNSEQVIDYVVLKTIRRLEPEYIARLRSEANIATLLKHENIVKTYGLESIPFDSLPRAFREDLEGLSAAQAEEVAGSTPAQRFNPLEEREEFASLTARERVEIEEPDPLGLTGERTIPAEEAPEKEVKKLYVMVMDYVEGTDFNALMREHLRRGLLMPVELGAFAISRMCRALGYAHKYIVHRDISPENILINDQGVCKLSDFGIAVGAEQAVLEMAGKFEYMSPEQIFLRPIDARSDIYSLGLVAYYIATGINLHLSPTAKTPAERIAYVKSCMEKPVVPPCEVCTDIPQVYSDIIMRMLEPDPNRRYQDINEAGRDLEKTYLYATGFGPTNNSMEAYLQIFRNKFQNPTREQLQQLTFLGRADGRIHLRRHITRELYGPKGLALIQERPSSWIYKLVCGAQASEPKE